VQMVKVKYKCSTTSPKTIIVRSSFSSTSCTPSEQAHHRTDHVQMET
jgi:hypothetical protein